MIHNVFHRVILASQSPARRALLETLKIPFEVVPSYLDEDILKDKSRREGLDEAEIALSLAVAKATVIAEDLVDPDALVIGADQILICQERWFDKPTSLEEVHEQLSFLQGKEHQLHSAACIVKGKEVIWKSVETPHLTMRSISPDELDRYIAAYGDGLINCLGGYRLELKGLDIFTKFEGEITTIIGLPLKKIAPVLEGFGIKAHCDEGLTQQDEQKHYLSLKEFTRA